MEGISSQLLTKKYYQERLSMFLRESLGIKERINCAADILNQLDKIYDGIFSYLDIWGLHYNTYKNYNSTSTDNHFLDLIGSILNCPRTLAINYGDGYKITNNQFVIGSTTHTITYVAGVPTLVDGTIPVTDNTFTLTNTKYYIDTEYVYIYPTTSAVTLCNKKYITLNNFEYLIYLKYQIMKSHFDGTREQLSSLYGGENGPGRFGIQIIYIPVTTENLPSACIYANDAYLKNYSLDFKYMFINGLLTIESLGIKYTRIIGLPVGNSKWDTVNTKWDAGKIWG